MLPPTMVQLDDEERPGIMKCIGDPAQAGDHLPVEEWDGVRHDGFQWMQTHGLADDHTSAAFGHGSVEGEHPVADPVALRKI
jgi:hypothetical protein